MNSTEKTKTTEVINLMSPKGKKRSAKLGQRMVELTQYKGLGFLHALEQALKEKI